MPIFLLIRHGENDFVKQGRLAGRLPGVHLNEKGLAQAAEVAENLKGAPIKAVYSSPLERTMETAVPIAHALDLEVLPRTGLLEVDVGEWQNKTLKELQRRKIWRAVQISPSRALFPEGESFAEAQLRICQEIESLALRHSEKELVVCVTHSDLIKLAVAYFIGLPLDMFQRLQIAPASISVLQVGETSSRLLTLNYDISFTLLED